MWTIIEITLVVFFIVIEIIGISNWIKQKRTRQLYQQEKSPNKYLGISGGGYVTLYENKLKICKEGHLFFEIPYKNLKVLQRKNRFDFIDLKKSDNLGLGIFFNKDIVDKLVNALKKEKVNIITEEE